MRDELGAKSAEFKDHLRALAGDVAFYTAAAAALAAMRYEEMKALVNSSSAAALPSAEVPDCGSFEKEFECGWSNHEEARNWALEVLADRTTFAADGSQIYAAKKTSLPIAAIQVGWFENPHNASQPYQKGGRLEILTPADLFRDQEDPMNPDIRVEERRYLGEVARISEFLIEHDGWEQRGERMPLVFFDNPLLVPFSQKGLQKSFLDATVELVRLSGATRVPLVGYVDRSFSRDLLSLLDVVGKRSSPLTSGLFDAALLFRSAAAVWGRRTCYFYSMRRGLESFIDPTTGTSTVGFCYLQTTVDAPPARLDVPAWVYDSGHLDEVADIVRAECIVGLGYPYPLESADQAAVISGADREAFFRALQEFATREKLDFSVSRKDESKSRRR